MLKSASKDSIPIPKIAIILLIIPYLSSGLLYNIKPINGTITTFIAVKKAFFASKALFLYTKTANAFIF